MTEALRPVPRELIYPPGVTRRAYLRPAKKTESSEVYYVHACEDVRFTPDAEELFDTGLFIDRRRLAVVELQPGPNYTSFTRMPPLVIFEGTTYIHLRFGLAVEA